MKRLPIAGLCSMISLFTACGEDSSKGLSPEQESSSSEEIISSSSFDELIESSSESEPVNSYRYKGAEHWSVEPDSVFFGEGNSVGEAYPCEGYCVNYSLKAGATYPGIKLVFDLPDLSNWDGVCITYIADHGAYFEQYLPDSLLSIYHDSPVYVLAATTEKKTVDAYWNDFQFLISKKGATGLDFAKSISSVKILISHLAGTEGKIEVYQIGAPGYCE